MEIEISWQSTGLAFRRTERSSGAVTASQSLHWDTEGGYLQVRPTPGPELDYQVDLQSVTIDVRVPVNADPRQGGTMTQIDISPINQLCNTLGSLSREPIAPSSQVADEWQADASDLFPQCEQVIWNISWVDAFTWQLPGAQPAAAAAFLDVGRTIPGSRVIHAFGDVPGPGFQLQRVCDESVLLGADEFRKVAVDD